LKSLIYAGLTSEDPRVQAATGWIAQHYELDSNPGIGDAGLYYYYQTFAKCLATLGQPMFVDQQGVAHDWRKDLILALAARQRPDGAWSNANERWMESNPNLVTGYALLALSYARPGPQVP
jgi:squalene-hopene/tetraprenyl-beta-curcumene cyclase